MLFLVLSFEVIQYFPGAAILRELWLLTVVLALLCIYLPIKLLGGLKFSAFEFYVLALFALPFLSAFQAAREFGQPLGYGLLAQRGIAMGAAALLFLLLCRRRQFLLGEIETALVTLAWVSLLTYSGTMLLLDPSEYADYHTEFVTGGAVAPLSFKFDSTFIVFGFLYYAFKAFRRHSLRSLGIALPFLVYILIGDGGRALLLATLASYSICYWRWASARRVVWAIPAAIATLLAIAGAVVTFAPEEATRRLERFGAAFTVALSGLETEDVSANARIAETIKVWPYIAKNWLVGSGDLSHRWNDGYESVFGYFYPADIGILGVLFQYGLVGVVAFWLQFRFAVRLDPQPGRRSDASPALLDGTRAFLICYALYSLVSGALVNAPAITLTFIAILRFATLGSIASDMRRIHPPHDGSAAHRADVGRVADPAVGPAA